MPSASPQIKTPRHILLLRLFAVVALGAIAYGTWWGMVARYYEHTDNAYVGGNVVQITPQINGTVTTIHADDTDFVKAQQPLIQLDPRDAQLAFAQAEAELAQQVRQFETNVANEQAAHALVQQRQSELVRAQQDAQRREQAESEAVTREEVAHARQGLQSAQAALAQATAQLTAQRALVKGYTLAQYPAVVRAAAKVRESALAVERTRLLAPVAGYVAKRNVQVGQRVVAGTPLMAVVPLQALWVEANFKESQLARMRVGQSVRLFADVYGKAVEYHGTVLGLGAGTGGAFSLLPAQNATGNWIKVVQRVPVRIALDAATLKAHPLRVGLSMQAEVDVHPSTGEALTTSVPHTLHPQPSLPVNSAAIEARITQIIAENRLNAPVKQGANQ